ncbi:MAG: T9SS type A sorting domain-containing protein [bacterium]
MKTKFYFIVLLILSSSLFAQKNQTDFSICGSIDEVPLSIIPVNGLGGWINCATDDGHGNVFISQSDLVHNAHLNGGIDITYSVPVMEEAISIDYNNGRIVCGTMGDYVTTFLPGSSSAFVENFQYNLSGGIGIDRVDLDADYLYILEMNSNYYPDMIHILDWTNGPNSNEPIGSYHPTNTEIKDFKIDGNTIFIVGKFDGVDKLVVLDVTNKNNPVEAASVDIENATSVGFDDVYVFVGCKSQTGNDGLRVFLRSNIATVFRDVFRSLIDFDQIFIQGNRMFVRDGINLIVINITHYDTGVEPVVLGQAGFTDFSQWSFTIGGVVGNNLYFTDSGQFGIIDITSLAQIFLAGKFISPRVVWDLEMDNNRMVLVGDGIYSYNITDPADPQLISNGELDGAQKVFMYDNQCFVANNTFGMYIFDIDNLGTQVGHYVSKSPDQANFVDMAFNSAYCYAICDDNLEIFSRTEDEYPGGTWPRKLMSRTEIGAFASSVLLDGNFLYVAHENGLSIYNVMSPTDPTLFNTINIPGAAGLGKDENFYIVCNVENGSTYLSAYDAVTNPPTFLKKQNIADSAPLGIGFQKVMDLIDGLILVTIQNTVQSFVYIPESNEFAVGPIYTDDHGLDNIKAYAPPDDEKKIKNGYDDTEKKRKKKRHAGGARQSYGAKRLQMLGGTHAYFTGGKLIIASDDDIDIKIGRDSQGYVTINGQRAVDESGNPIPADQVTSIKFNDNGSYSNEIDFSDVNSTTFPNLPPNTLTENNTTVNCGGGNEKVIAGNSGVSITGSLGNDVLIGGSGVDNLSGGSGNDYLYYGGNDQLNGGSGDDTFINQPANSFSNNKNHSYSELVSKSNSAEDPIGLDDESGTDTLNFGQNPVNRKINLDLPGVAQTIDNIGLRIVLNAQIECFIGGDGVDVVTVKPLADAARYIDGGGSKATDTLYFDTDGLNAVDDGSTITVEGYEPITYANFSQVIVGDVIVNVEEYSVPTEFKLCQNYPNPFNPTTTIKYAVPSNPPLSPFIKGGSGEAEGDLVTLKIYDILGQEVTTLVNKEQKPGNYSVTFNAGGLASGVYFYRIHIKDFCNVKKMMILK